MNQNRINLYSSLPLAECVSRLNIFLGLRDACPIMGRVSDTSLRVRKRIAGRNAFQIRLVAEIRPGGAGTIISGSFAMHPFVRLITVVWFIGLFLGCGAIFLRTLGLFIDPTSQRSPDAWVGLAGPPLILLVVYGSFRLVRELARREAGFITNHLIGLLETGPSDAT